MREKKVNYEQVKKMDPKKFGDLESTMKMIFNHDEDQTQHQLPDGLTPSDVINMHAQGQISALSSLSS